MHNPVCDAADMEYTALPRCRADLTCCTQTGSRQKGRYTRKSKRKRQRNSKRQWKREKKLHSC